MSISLNRKNKVKLFKDLKQGKTNLRQSLLQETEIVNVNKIFEAKKQSYHIENKQIDHQKQRVDRNPEEGQQLFLSPQKRIQLYKKQKANRRMKQKLKHLFRAEAQKRAKMRPPVIQKMLQEFQAKYRKEDSNQLLDGLKQSQNNLQNIRINSRKKPLDKQSQGVSRISRRKMISLETGLPQDPKENYPSVGEVIKGRYTKTEVKKYSFDMHKFESQLDKYISEKIVKPHQQNGNNHSYYSHHNIHTLNGQKNGWQSQNVKKKRSAQRSFNKTQKSSKNIINTMSQFYESKGSKKIEYDQMLLVLKHDRPISTKIRRKNYTIIGNHVQDVQVYRLQAEKQRRNLIRKNHELYMSLVAILQYEDQESVKTSISICEEIKQVFSSNYQLDVFTFHDILARYDREEYDSKTHELIAKIQAYLATSN